MLVKSYKTKICNITKYYIVRLCFSYILVKYPSGAFYQ
jgi:hypothetical protein